MPKAKGGLGRGIGAIFAENSVDQTSPAQLALSEIEPNRAQPRKQFDPAGLAEEPCDLLFLDIDLGAANGIEVARALRRTPARYRADLCDELQGVRPGGV